MSRPDVPSPLFGKLDLGNMGLPDWCIISVGLVVALGLAINFFDILSAWWKNRMRNGTGSSGERE